jgi:D-alanyl-D-alanine carboxypeptidase
MTTRQIIFQITAISVFALAVAHVVAVTLGVYGQTTNNDPGLITRTGKQAPAIRTETKSNSTVATGAAAEMIAGNLRSKGSLQWNFAGKVQTGWEIYIPLIARTIETDASVDSAEFARAVNTWQTRSGLPTSGMIDAATLEALVTFWQSQRRYSKEEAQDDRLISAPITDFYDPTRDAELLKLEASAYAAYKQMVAAAAKDLSKHLVLTRTGELAPGEKMFRIVSAFRSREYQEELRRRSPGSGRGALAKFSAHSTGQALDIYVGGEPVSTRDANRAVQINTPAYRWLVKNARRFGFVPYFYEPWHWEYVGR